MIFVWYPGGIGRVYERLGGRGCRLGRWGEMIRGGDVRGFRDHLIVLLSSEVNQKNETTLKSVPGLLERCK